jgi:hypothetical protein
MKVDFLIAGTQKGGTTALRSYLQDHRSLCLAEEKETHFFDAEEHFGRGEVDYGPLHAHFRPKPGQLLGEATPITMYWADAPRRVWEYNPRMKMICVLRNPIERAFSHWNMERERGEERLSFLDALKREAERYRTDPPRHHRSHSYIDRGYYSEQIRRLWRFFPPAQTLFLSSEELLSRPQTTLDQVFDFLEVSRQRVEPRILHARTYPLTMGVAEWDLLRDVYQWEVREVGRLLNWDCVHWLDRSTDIGELSPG